MYGDQLKFLRMRARRTQQDCADALGITQTGYSAIENERFQDETRIPWRIIAKLVPVIVGHGTPPVHFDHLAELSDAHDFEALAAKHRKGEP